MNICNIHFTGVIFYLYGFLWPRSDSAPDVTSKGERMHLIHTIILNGAVIAYFLKKPHYKFKMPQRFTL